MKQRFGVFPPRMLIEKFLPQKGLIDGGEGRRGILGRDRGTEQDTQGQHS
jgi:hypothetical protein